MKIGHFFVHSAVESEYLKELGDVTAFGLECDTDRNVSEFIICDLTSEIWKKIPENYFNFGLFHPPCQPFSVANSENYNSDYDNLIPIARDIANKVCEYYVIENVPKAPLNNPVYLNGKMFDLSIKYERAFESNYNIPQPNRDKSNRGYGAKNIAHLSDFEAMRIKQYNFKYHSLTMVRNCLPKPYVKYLTNNCPIF